MCLAIPGKIVSIKGNMATVDYGPEKREADCSFIKTKIGDYVIIQNKIVVEKIPEKEAIQALKTWQKALK